MPCGILILMGITRDQQVAFYVNKKEKELIERQADSECLTVSSFLRRLAIRAINEPIDDK